MGFSTYTGRGENGIEQERRAEPGPPGRHVVQEQVLLEKHLLGVFVLEIQRQQVRNKGGVVRRVGPLQQLGRAQPGIDEAGGIERLLVHVARCRALPRRPAPGFRAGAGRAVRRIEEGRQAIGVVGIGEEARRVLFQARPMAMARLRGEAQLQQQVAVGRKAQYGLDIAAGPDAVEYGQRFGPGPGLEEPV